MINKRNLANDLTDFLALKQWQDENDIPDNKYIDADDIPELAKIEYRNNKIFHSKVNASLAVLMQTIDKHVEVDEISNQEPGVGFHQKPMASVHKLCVVKNAGVLDEVKDVSDDPSREYLDMIAEELIILTDHCVKGELRGIAISYVIMENDENILSKHNFITDGRGIASLNAGIDLVKDYIVDAMRERFGVRNGAE